MFKAEETSMKKLLIRIGAITLCAIILSILSLSVFAYELGDNDAKDDWDKQYVSADANDDGKVTTADLILVRQYITGLTNETALNITAADVSGDGSVTTADLILIRQYIAGLITEF